MLRKAGVALVAFSLILVGCEGDTINKNLERAKSYLSEGDFLNAWDEYTKVLEKDPENCEANYGVLLADVLMLIDSANAIIGLASGLGSTLTAQYQEIVDQLITSFLTPFVELFDEMDRAVQVIENKQCSFDPGYIILTVGTADSPFIQAAVKGAWDPAEAMIIGAVANLAKGILKLVLSVDLDLPLDPVLQIVNDPNSPILKSASGCSFDDIGTFFNTCDVTGLLRELGFVMNLTSTFLKWHPDRKYMFTEAAQEFSEAFRRIGNGLAAFFNDLEPTDEVVDNAFYIYDKDGNGAFSGLDQGDELVINAYKVYPGDITQETVIDESGRCLWSPALGEDVCLDSFLPLQFIYAFISVDYIDTVVATMEHWSEAFDVKTIEYTGVEPEPVSVSSVLSLIPSKLGITLPDVIRVKPWKLFASSLTDEATGISGPRDWLPFWGDIDGDGALEFYVEGEWSEGSSVPADWSSYLFPGDATHFVTPITPPGETSSPKVEIPADCVFIEDSPTPDPDTEGLIIYMAFQDPSYNGAVEVNISNLDTSLQCSNECESIIESQSDAEGWYMPEDPWTSSCGIYAINKVLAGLYKNLTTTLSGLSEIIGGF